MRFYNRQLPAAALLISLGIHTAALASSAAGGTVVRFDTVEGVFDIQLFDDIMPVTVQNFLGYADAGRFDGSVVHRNSDTSDPLPRDFVIQGGGFFLHDPTPPNEVVTFSRVVDDNDLPINDEPGGGVPGPSNVRGTIAMAKSGPNTVTSQWFINQGDNSFLDSPARPDGGFSAFGMVLGDGMTVVDAIGDLPLPGDFGFGIGSPFNDLPLRNFSGTGITDVREIHTVVVNSISTLALTPGDVNRDGVVDGDDLDVIEANYGTTEGAFLDSGDVDMDGDVDARDFAIWQRGVGVSGSVANVSSVPEPGAALWLLGAAISLLRRRCRQI